MGKGDKKTKKGKIAQGSFGVSRPRPARKKKDTDVQAAGGLKEKPKTRKAGPSKKK